MIKYFDALMLLYAAVNGVLSEKAEVQGHLTRWETFDLSVGWESIERNTLGLVTASDW